MKWKRGLYDYLRFETTAYLLSAEYVGAGVIATPTNRLHTNMQVFRDPDYGHLVSKIVQVHYKSCLNIIAEMQDAPFEVNVCEIFYNTLSEPLQTALNSAGYTIPTSDGVTNEIQLNNLCTLHNEAERQEEHINQIGRIAQVSQRPYATEPLSAQINK